ncbi:MAG: T9SS type A sorting domain-containing protein, partial [Taibaiella sp.]|nr:T9SS type A sorting domain-containing protein [Taibaiella sp.]
ATAAETVPYRITIDAAGNLYAAEYWYDKVRIINTAGIITTFAGTGSTGFSGDGGPASAAKLKGPYGVAADRFGNIFINDQANHRIRKVSYTGNIYTICGTGTFGHTGDGGPATNARIGDPRNVSVDDSGNVYFADINLHNVRKITRGNRLPFFTAGASHNLSACMNSAPVALGSALAIRDSDIGQPVTWSILSTAAHGVMGGFPTTLPSTGAVVTPAAVFYTPASGYTGPDTFIIRVSDSMDADTISVYVMVNALPDAGSISGAGVLCVGETVEFTSSITGGTWHASNSNINITGSNVTGMVIGSSTIFYTITTSCGSDTAIYPVSITNTPYAGTITGDSVMCPMEASHIIPTMPGGTWATRQPTVSTIDAGGTVLGLTPGRDTVMYMVNSPCGEDTAYLGIFVKSYKTCRTGIEATISDYYEQEMSIIPNPNNGMFHISLLEECNYSLKIINVLGQTVYEKALVKNGTKVDIDVLPGVYIITLQNESSNIRRQITIE